MGSPVDLLGKFCAESKAIGSLICKMFSSSDINPIMESIILSPSIYRSLLNLLST